MDDIKDNFNFVNRYPFEAKISLTPSKIKESRANYIRISNNNLDRMQKMPNRPASMEYFEKSVIDPKIRVNEIMEFKARGGKVIGTFCVQIPEEIIYAAGAIPIRMECGFYDAIDPAEEIIPKNTCPLIKSSVGFNFLKINPLFELCDVVIIPTTCDGKKKMADILSNYKIVWVLELPNNKENSATKEFWNRQMTELKLKLEKLTGNKITKKILKEQILLLHKRTALIRELFNLRMGKKIVITGRDVYLILQAAFYDDIKRWMLNLEGLISELKKNIIENRVIADENTPRIIMTGSALIWPNMKLLHVIEESGAIVVGDDSCACGQYFYNPVELEEWSMKTMIEAIGDKYLLPLVCPVFLYSDDRVDRLLELAQQYQADGVIYHVLRLCQVFDFEFVKVSKVFEKKNIPIIKIESEYSEEDVGQIKTRIEAFVEMMEARK